MGGEIGIARSRNGIDFTRIAGELLTSMPR
jgi:hypothetical protein